MAVPASIRNKNAGAMYPGPSSEKFGAVGFEVLRSADGEHKIATFPTHEQGAAAMFDLLASQTYVGKTIEEAVTKWCDGLRAEAYVDALEARGIDETAKLTRQMVIDADFAIPLAKAMAFWEAGKKYPLSDKGWRKAHDMAFSGLVTPPVEEVPIYVAEAIKKLGQREIRGPRHNASIVRDFELVGRPDVKNDETAWCAAFIGARLHESGYKLPPVPSSEILMARSYLKLPIKVSPGSVRVGDIRVESRGPAPFGHVEMVVAVNKAAGTCKTIAGNVSDSVAYRTKPLKGGNLLGYRRPSKDPAPVKFVVRSTPFQAIASAVLAGVAYVSGAIEGALDGVSWAYQTVAWGVGVLPTAINDAGPAVSSFQQLSSWLDMTAPRWVLAGVVAGALGSAIWSLWKAERAK